LLIARDVPEAQYGSGSRIVNLPGITVSVQEMLDALHQVAGDKALSLLDDSPEKAVIDIVESWPAEFDVSRARDLGFQTDGSLVKTIQEYIEDYQPKTQPFKA
jgi:D-erythronate 2-dehydrogenase